MHLTKKIKDLIADPECVFISNHSGGKDSQIMYLELRKVVPADRLIVIHAHLPEVEWEGTEEFIRETVEHEFHVVQAVKTFFEMVEHRGMFPSPENRQCTSDLKRGPIQKKVREICRERGFTKVVNCMGFRAEESAARKKKKVWKWNKSLSVHKRVQRKWYDWAPIHKKKEAEVFAGIEAEGQKPFWTYGAGMTRKSCVFCIMASEDDLCLAAKLRPQLAEKYDYWENKTGHTMIMPSTKHGKRTIKQIVEHKNTSL